MEENILERYPFLPPRFIALDFETTGLNAGEDKIIEIGAVKFNLHTNQRDTYSTLINPFISISKRITKLTGITNDMVKVGSTLEKELPMLKSFVEDLPIVCHSTQFDMAFLGYEAERLNLVFDNAVYCSLKLSKAAFDLKSYKLAAVAEHCGIPIGTTHRALDDALLAGQIFIHTAAKLGTISPYPLRHSSPYASSKGKAQKPAPNQNGKHVGEVVVFTGQFVRDKEELEQMAADVGVKINVSISKKVSFLVVGKQDITVVGPSGKSTKQVKAQEYNDKGLTNIEFLTEEEFIARFS